MGLVDNIATTAQVRDQLGRPMRDLRISVIDNCNLRCPYCMPVDTFGEGYRFLSQDELLSFDEIHALATAFARLGVVKLRITGGEPLLRPGLPELITRLRTIDGIEDIALTTNGLLLRKQAAPLADAGLGRLTVSLDALDDATNGIMNGRGLDTRHVLAGIDAARDAGFAGIKVNAVVKRSVNDHAVLELVEHFRGTDVIVRFIEYMDVGTRNGWRLDEVVPSRELRDRIHDRFPIRPLDATYRGEVASRYAFEDGQGEVGFISSVTETFCGGCTRARLSADGKLFTCLFASDGTDLRALLREGASNDDLVPFLQSVWAARDDRYSELRSASTPDIGSTPKVEMYQIGG